MAETGKRLDPFAAFNFTLNIDGLGGSHGFSECTGANTEQDVIEYREGNTDPKLLKLPGLKKFGDITLRRGFTTNKELWQWRQTVLQGKTVRRTGSIVLNDEGGKPALTWKFTAAWPRQYSAPNFNGTGSEVAIEELILVVETLELDAK
ncbi:phage tail protein [Saccharothrix syringae]|uniref:Phage tail protein n=1 Tax=Saccharothrix syringae TaxID=103733 RepID=A0A5Q0GYS1_SACSY|nr:phage tail protein [Saccharothrix syringae]QFZ18650.1 phage tail protein [Saccharothrix syringae]